MSAWSHGSFGNDAALDWSSTLEGCSDLTAVDTALQKVVDIGDCRVDATAACEAVAAVEVVARLLGHSGLKDAYSAVVDQWVETHDVVPGNVLVDKASLVLGRIETAPSELLELWEDTGELPEWFAAITELRTRLQAKRRRARKARSKAEKKTLWTNLQEGALFEIRTHTGRSLIGQILVPGNDMYICVLDCTGDAYRSNPESILSAQNVFEGRATDVEFEKQIWVICGHAEVREYQKPFHVVHTNNGFELRDFYKTFVRFATAEDEALYGFESYFSGASFTGAVSRYFVDGLDALYGHIDVRRLREKSQLA